MTRSISATTGRPTRLAAPLALLLLLSLGLPLGAGCRPAAVPAAPPAAAPAPASTSSAAITPPGASPSDDPLKGTWWVLLPDRPYIAFCLSLADRHGDQVEGSWTSFDWLATRQDDDLRHKSKGVKVTGQLKGAQLTIRGAEPMLDANGSPNGQRGDWTLVLKVSNLPGEALRYSGLATCSELKDAAEIPVSLEPRFRPWKP